MKLKLYGFLVSSLIVFSISLFATEVAGQAVGKPLFAGYKGVMVGMTMADARAKLGNPRDKSDTEDYYVFSENETAQVLYDTNKTVRVISVNYIGKSDAPVPRDVLGTDIAPKPDGSMNKMVKYPKGGYWVSYLRTAGDNPMVIITVQKMPSGQ